MNSDKDEVWFENHMKIDNTNLEPDNVADMIIEKFSLELRNKKEAEYKFGVK